MYIHMSHAIYTIHPIIRFSNKYIKILYTVYNILEHTVL